MIRDIPGTDVTVPVCNDIGGKGGGRWRKEESPFLSSVSCSGQIIGDTHWTCTESEGGDVSGLGETCP